MFRGFVVRPTAEVRHPMGTNFQIPRWLTWQVLRVKILLVRKLIKQRHLSLWQWADFLNIPTLCAWLIPFFVFVIYSTWSLTFSDFLFLLFLFLISIPVFPSCILIKFFPLLLPSAFFFLPFSNLLHFQLYYPVFRCFLISTFFLPFSFPL